MISNLPNASSYNEYAYRTPLLRQFARRYEAEQGGGGGNNGDGSFRRSAQMPRHLSLLGDSNTKNEDLSLSSSIRRSSAIILGQFNRQADGVGRDGGEDRNSNPLPNSVHGSNIFEGHFKKKKNKRGRSAVASGVGGTSH